MLITKIRIIKFGVQEKNISFDKELNMIDLNKIIINFDFFHCIERDGFVFTSIDEPANILDAIVIRCPENSVSITPQKSFSKKT